VATSTGREYRGRAVILTTGTFLAGRILSGEKSWPAGRSGEFPATGLSARLRELGCPLARLQTNTPPRIAARTIDFSFTEIPPGSDVLLCFSGPAAQPLISTPDVLPHFLLTPPDPVYPHSPIAWRPQLPCYSVYTTPQTLDIVRGNLHRSPIAPGTLDAA